MSAPFAGYSGKPLIEKLGLKPGQRLVVIDPPADYDALVAPLPEGAVLERGGDGAADLVHLFAPDRAGLERRVRDALARVAPGGMLWVSWPKKSSACFRDLTEDGVREVVLPTGWVDVKVAAVDQDWSGLKFLRRKT